MASSFTLIALFCLALLADNIQARKYPGEYWQGQAVSQNKDLFGAIERLTPVNNVNKRVTRADWRTGVDQSNSFLEEFEPRPNVSSYGEEGELKGDKSYVKDFEPRPNVSAYGADDKLKEDKSYVKDFEPRPNVSAYGEDDKLKEDKSNVRDFELMPNVSAYG